MRIIRSLRPRLAEPCSTCTVRQKLPKHAAYCWRNCTSYCLRADLAIATSPSMLRRWEEMIMLLLAK